MGDAARAPLGGSDDDFAMRTAASSASCGAATADYRARHAAPASRDAAAPVRRLVLLKVDRPRLYQRFEAAPATPHGRQHQSNGLP